MDGTINKRQEKKKDPRNYATEMRYEKKKKHTLKNTIIIDYTYFVLILQTIVEIHTYSTWKLSIELRESWLCISSVCRRAREIKSSYASGRVKEISIVDVCDK